jgi:uncharacterized protein
MRWVFVSSRPTPFLSKQAAARFKGYLHSQRQGLMGLRSGGTRNQGRADIREKYGFDCKFAMRVLRNCFRWSAPCAGGLSRVCPHG